jgi:hypothetical protein
MDKEIKAEKYKWRKIHVCINTLEKVGQNPTYFDYLINYNTLYIHQV